MKKIWQCLTMRHCDIKRNLMGIDWYIWYKNVVIKKKSDVVIMCDFPSFKKRGLGIKKSHCETPFPLITAPEIVKNEQKSWKNTKKYGIFWQDTQKRYRFCILLGGTPKTP